MPSITSLRFDLANWHIKERSEHRIVWFNWVPDMLVLEYSPHPIAFPAALNDLASLRAFTEYMVRQNAGAVISVEKVVCDELEGMKSIFKYRQTPSSKRSPLGTAYLGLYIFPLAELHYILKVQCCEYGPTGLREAAIAMLHPRPERNAYKLISSMEELLIDMGQQQVRATLADEEQYDVSFPSHPLSRLRGYLKHIEETITVDESVKLAEPFVRD